MGHHTPSTTLRTRFWGVVQFFSLHGTRIPDARETYRSVAPRSTVGAASSLRGKSEVLLKIPRTRTPSSGHRRRVCTPVEFCTRSALFAPSDASKPQLNIHRNSSDSYYPEVRHLPSQ